MQTPYYFAVDDRTTHHYYLYETNELEPTEETRTLIGRFPYKVKVLDYSPLTPGHVQDRVQHLITERIRLTGGCHLLTAWIEAQKTQALESYLNEKQYTYELYSIEDNAIRYVRANYTARGIPGVQHALKHWQAFPEEQQAIFRDVLAILA
jgi:hypothetical protein